MPPARRHVGLATISSTFSPYLKKDQQILQNPPKPKVGYTAFIIIYCYFVNMSRPLNLLKLKTL